MNENPANKGIPPFASAIPANNESGKVNAKTPNNESYNMGFNDGYLVGTRQENIPDYIDLTSYETGFKIGCDKYLSELHN